MLTNFINWLNDLYFERTIAAFTRAELRLLNIVNQEASTQAAAYERISDIQSDIKVSQARELRAEKWLAVIPKVED